MKLIILHKTEPPGCGKMNDKLNQRGCGHEKQVVQHGKQIIGIR